MFAIYNDNILLLNMHAYTLYNNIEYNNINDNNNNNYNNNVFICDKNPYVLLPCLYYVYFPSSILFDFLKIYSFLFSSIHFSTEYATLNFCLYINYDLIY